MRNNVLPLRNRSVLNIIQCEPLSTIHLVKSSSPFSKCEIKICSTATESLAASPLTRRDSKYDICYRTPSTCA